MKHFNTGLIRNFLTVGFRSITRYKQYSLINLLGLIIGLSSVFCIAIFIYGELTFDHHHENGEDIYRVNVFYFRPTSVTRYPLIPPAFAPAVKASYPEVKNISRVRYAYDVLMKHQHKSFYEERVFFAEPDFVKMFSHQTIKGDALKTLTEPNSVVITERIALKYFGAEEPIGQLIEYNEELSLIVGAVIQDVPENSHFSFDFLISFNSYQPGPGSLADLTSWRWLGFLTYIQLEENASIKALEEGMADLYISSRKTTSNNKLEINLQPLYDIYLKSGDISNPMGGLFKGNSYQNVMSLAIVALLTIVIAFFNYLNIVTALMRTRTKEMGIRKVFGTSKKLVVTQLVIETLILVVLAGVLSAGVLMVVHALGILQLSGYFWIFILLTIVAIIGLLFSLITGTYIGLVLSKHSVMSLINNRLSVTGKKYSFRHVVLFVQYLISASLVTISLIVIAQLKYFNEKELGYNAEGVLVAPFRGVNVDTKIEPLRNTLLQSPLVKAVSFGPAMDGSSSGSPLRLKEWPEDQTVQTAYFGVDFDYQKLMNLDLVAGRFFSEKIKSDSSVALMINEQLAEKLDVDNPIGQKVIFAGGQEYEIIGVYGDFHYQSLHHQIGPMALMISTRNPRNVLIRVNTSDVSASLQYASNSWSTLFPGNEYPFQYRFLDQQLADLYAGERSFSDLIGIFTGLAIFVALLGLYGLSSVTLHLNIKQISIRRVLGAKLLDIFKLVSQRFFAIAILASIISWPLVVYLMDQWLENFAYSIEVGYGFLIQMFVLVLLITLVTMVVQAMRVTNTNPSRILKDE